MERVPDYEKLGVFYLGRPYDAAAKKPLDGIILYKSKDLTTHAVCVGMTGSGKTGLCIGLLEEAAMDGIPALIIDPRGDMPNLLLAFPELGERISCPGSTRMMPVARANRPPSTPMVRQTNGGKDSPRGARTVSASPAFVMPPGA